MPVSKSPKLTPVKSDEELLDTDSSVQLLRTEGEPRSNQPKILVYRRYYHDKR